MLLTGSQNSDSHNLLSDDPDFHGRGQSDCGAGYFRFRSFGQASGRWFNAFYGWIALLGIKIYMEIIFELILGLFEVTIETFGEILIELIGQILIDFGINSFGEVFTSRPKRNPYMAFVGYSLFGVVIGGISLLILTNSIITSPGLKLLNLCITPFIGGIAMALIGRWRSKKGQDLLRFNSFAYGFSFALGVAVIRYFFAH